MTVIDASVAAKWYLPPWAEPQSAAAREYARRHMAGEEELLVPDFFWAELGNALCKAARRGRYRAEDATVDLRRARDLGLGVMASAVLLERAWTIAWEHGQTVYDCLYVAAAMEVGGVLVTADERLATALAARFPVRLLGYA